ncbi:hypothetical protein A2W14_04585, partial [Candidatus Gottesmanbacteria bacterium RBG_16_37_8]
MYRLLIGVLDDKKLSNSLYFKGGTCAAMLGYLDRFSIDLDFDLKRGANKSEIRIVLKKVYKQLAIQMKEEAKNELFFVLKYEAPKDMRNTLKIGIMRKPVWANVYQPLYLADISRYAICQTKETMFANKLVAVTDRYKKYKTIAGRDFYDVHHFFLSGFDYKREIIEERTGKKWQSYLKELSNFIKGKVTDKHLQEDLSTLLPGDKFRAIRKSLKIETLAY